MLTPQEVQDKKFKQAMFGGYEMTAVDGFLEGLTRDYSALFVENAALKKRLNTLTKSLEKYQKEESDVRKALLEVQRMAQQKVEEASEIAAGIVEQANGETQGQLEHLRAEIALEEQRLDMARKETVQFVNGLRKLYTEQMERLSIIPEETPPPVKSKTKSAAEQAVEEIGRSVAEATKIIAEEDSGALLAPPPAPPPVRLPLKPPPPPPPLTGKPLSAGRQEKTELEETEAPSPASDPEESAPPSEDDTNFALVLENMDEFEREQDTEVPIRRPLDEATLEENFGHHPFSKNKRR